MAEMTMVGRVARAIDPRAFEQEEICKGLVEAAGRTWNGSWEHNLHRAKVAVALKRSRAAIEAMGAMMDDPDTLSAVLHDFDGLRSTFRREPNSAFREFWYAAIKKALNEEVAR